MTNPARLKPQQQVPIFTLQDMRFFQHFLTACLPRHPLCNEDVWSHEVPCLSQNVCRSPFSSPFSRPWPFPTPFRIA